MKTILAFYFLAIVVAVGQYPYPEPKPTTGNTPNTVTRMSLPVAPQAYNNLSPIVWDTDIGGGLQSRVNSSDRLAVRWARPGALVFDASDATYYAMEGNPLQATKPLFRLDGTWVNDTSIYTKNGQLTGHRVMDGNGFNLVMIGLDQYYVIGKVIRLRGQDAVLLETPRVQSGDAQVGEVPVLDNVNGTFEWHPAPNLYHVNGVLSGDRNVQFNSHQLDFDAGTGAFLVHGLPGSASIFVTGITRIEAAQEFTLRTPEMVAGMPKVGNVLTVQPNGTSEFKPPTGGNTIYTSNGTLTSDRTVTSSGHDLTFDIGADQFNVTGGPTSSASIVANSILEEAPGGYVLRTPEVIASGAVAKAGHVLTLQSDGKAEFKLPTGASINSGVATLAGGLYTVATPTPPYTSSSVYPDFFTIEMRVPGVNSGGESIKWGSGPSKAIKMSNGNAIPLGELAAGPNYLLSYSVTADAWILKNPAGTFVPGDSTLTMTTPAGSTVSTIVVNPAALTPANNSVTANKLSFVNPQSFMASGASSGAGTEAKLGPMFVVRNGYLVRNFRNIMFEVNSYFVTGAFQDTVNWQSLAGTGTPSAIGGVAGHAGILVVNTATGATTFGGFGMRGDSIDFEPGNKLYFYCRVRIPLKSVSGGEAYKFTIGFGDNASAALLDTDCMAFTYTDNEQGGRWNFDVGAASVHTQSDSGVTVSDTAGVWYELELEATTTSVDWWVDGVQKTSVTTNIPIGANKFTPLIRIVGISGSTARNIQVDQVNAWGVYSF